MIPGRRFAAALRATHWGQVLVELALLVVRHPHRARGQQLDRRPARRTRRAPVPRTPGPDLDRDLVTLDEALRFEQTQAANSALAYRASVWRSASHRTSARPSRRRSPSSPRGARCDSAAPPTSDLLSTGQPAADPQCRIARPHRAAVRKQRARAADPRPQQPGIRGSHVHDVPARPRLRGAARHAQLAVDLRSRTEPLRGRVAARRNHGRRPALAHCRATAADWDILAGPRLVSRPGGGRLRWISTAQIVDDDPRRARRDRSRAALIRRRSPWPSSAMSWEESGPSPWPSPAFAGEGT